MIGEQPKLTYAAVSMAFFTESRVCTILYVRDCDIMNVVTSILNRVRSLCLPRSWRSPYANLGGNQTCQPICSYPYKRCHGYHTGPYGDPYLHRLKRCSTVSNWYFLSGVGFETSECSHCTCAAVCVPYVLSHAEYLLRGCLSLTKAWRNQEMSIDVDLQTSFT